VSFALLCSFVGGVEPFLPPLEELATCELCVWLISSIGCWSSFVAYA
jgi:hypothetical protein